MCGRRLKSLFPLLVLALSVCLPFSVLAGDYENLSKIELIKLVESLEPVLISAEKQIQQLEKDLLELKKLQQTQEQIYQEVSKLSERLKKLASPGLNLGIDAGVMVLDTNPIKLGFYAGVGLQF